MRIKRILLLDPPFFRFLNENQSSPPLGLTYLASALINSGFNDVVVYNADFDHSRGLKECNKAFFEEVNNFDLYKERIQNVSDPIYEEVLSTIAGYKPDLIGISIRTAKFFISETLIKLVKKNFPDTIIIAGGPHPTIEPEHVLLRTKADFVIRGEGEYILPELVRRINYQENNLLGLEGLSYRKNGKLRHNPAAALISDLDSIAFPNKDIILYRDALLCDDFGNIFSSRGCPFSCSFCDSRSIWTRKVRRRSPKNIVDEVSQVKEKYGTSFFGFYDDCFVTKSEHTIQLCEEIKNRGLNKLPKAEFRWWCEVHPQFISKEIVQTIKEANCVAVAIGAESGSQKILQRINKASSIDLIRKSCAIIKEAGLDLSLFFMIGFPYETEEDIYQTVEFMKELDPDSGNLSILTPHPGTVIYKECLAMGLIDYDADFINCFHQRNAHFYSPLISDERSKIIIYNAFKVVDELIGGNRKKKIHNILKNKIISQISQKFKARISFESQDYGDDNGATILLECDQNYAKRQIYIKLRGLSDTEFKFNIKGFIEELSKELLKELPQYLEAAVDITQKNQDEKYGNTFIFSLR